MLNNLLESACEKYGNKTALFFSGQRFTYYQLQQLTLRLASSFIFLNIQPGDKIAFFLTNRPEAILCFLACFKVGATVVPINQFFKSDKLTTVINETQPKIVITEQSLLAELPDHIIKQGHCYSTDNQQDDRIKSFNSLIENTQVLNIFPSITEDTIATISFTSGTTGHPKGALHNQGQLLEFLISHAKHAKYTSEDCILSYVPISFGYCFSNQILSSLYSGAAISLVPAGDWGGILDAIERDQPTLIYVGPTTLIHWLNTLKNRPVVKHKLRAIISAGDAMPIALHNRAKEMLGVTIYESIGMTETWLYAFNPVNEKMKLGSVGTICSGKQVKIVDENGKEVSPGIVGEIAVKGHSVTLGYYSGKTSVFKDGWFHTGDCGYLDEEGYLFFRGRKELALLKNDIKFFPQEIEFALYEHPAILETGVTQHENKIIAFVSLCSMPGSVTEKSLLTHLSHLLPREKMPDEIVFMPQLPKGITGKIDRKLLKNLS